MSPASAADARSCTSSGTPSAGANGEAQELSKPVQLARKRGNRVTDGPGRLDCTADH